MDALIGCNIQQLA